MGNEASTGRGGGGATGGGWNVSTNSNFLNAPKPAQQEPAAPPTPRNWTYQQSTGILCSPENVCSKIGYSGAGIGKNNPNLQDVPFVGPIPQGEYVIGKSITSPNTGPVAIPLKAVENQSRTDFQIHGDSAKHPGEASQGCIVLPRPVREEIDKSEIKTLMVIE